MNKLYIYSLSSERELVELNSIGKDWEGVSLISLSVDIDNLKPDELKKLGEDIIKGLIKQK